jgi:hypothetical protein
MVGKMVQCDPKKQYYKILACGYEEKYKLSEVDLEKLRKRKKDICWKRYSLGKYKVEYKKREAMLEEKYCNSRTLWHEYEFQFVGADEIIKIRSSSLKVLKR